MPAAAPIRPCHLVSTQQEVETLIPNDLTVFRDVLQVDFVSLRQPARHYTYRGLKILTLLSLRFHYFQRSFSYFGIFIGAKGELVPGGILGSLPQVG